MPRELRSELESRVQRLPMEDDHFSFGGANGQAHAEAELML